MFRALFDLMILSPDDLELTLSSLGILLVPRIYTATGQLAARNRTETAATSRMGNTLMPI